jgi:hypothetical protein
LKRCYHSSYYNNTECRCVNKQHWCSNRLRRLLPSSLFAMTSHNVLAFGQCWAWSSYSPCWHSVHASLGPYLLLSLFGMF